MMVLKDLKNLYKSIRTCMLMPLVSHKDQLPTFSISYPHFLKNNLQLRLLLISKPFRRLKKKKSLKEARKKNKSKLKVKYQSLILKMDFLNSIGDLKIMTLLIISRLTLKERKLTLSHSENLYISILNSIVRESKTKSARTV